MSFQYTYDTDGKPIGVFIPISEWEKISSRSADTKKSRLSSSSKEKILKSVERGLKQVNDIEKGKIKPISLKQLLDAL